AVEVSEKIAFSRDNASACIAAKGCEFGKLARSTHPTVIDTWHPCAILLIIDSNEGGSHPGRRRSNGMASLTRESNGRSRS
ncbi:UNVERIFIED_CONTAM: hypothetical protein NY603_36995, partial [Bacteroidetes bacterium 56_B9]